MLVYKASRLLSMDPGLHEGPSPGYVSRHTWISTLYTSNIFIAQKKEMSSD